MEKKLQKSNLIIYSIVTAGFMASSLSNLVDDPAKEI